MDNKKLENILYKLGEIEYEQESLMYTLETLENAYYDSEYSIICHEEAPFP